MRCFQKKQLQDGVTLLEVVLYIGIVTILLSAIIPFAWNIIEGGVKNSTEQEIFTQGQYVADRITYEIRNASDINSVSPTQISLATTTPGTNPTIISLNNGVINLQQGSASPIALNSVNTSIPSLTFTNYSSAGNNTNNIKFQFTIDAHYPGAGSRKEFNGSVIMEGSAEVRSDQVPPPPPPSNWYSSSWQYRQAITIDRTKVSSTQTNFPVLINLTGNTNLQNGAQAAGNDILFADATGTLLKFQIESYSSGNLAAWVKIPTLSAAANTTIYMYYGNSTPGLVSAQDPTHVWDSSYITVLHMNEGSGNVSDSTSNGNNGTSSNTTSVVGLFSNARHFNGSSTSTIDIADDATLDFGAGVNFTFSAWFNSTQAYTFNNYPVLIWKESLTAPRQGYSTFMCGSCGSNLLSNEIYTNSGTHYAINSNNYNDGNWHYVVSERNGSTIYIYVDGSLITSGAAANTDLSNSNDVRMGADAAGNGLYNGKEQEVRLSNIARSANWITTEYKNQSSPSTFYSVAAQETY